MPELDDVLSLDEPLKQRVAVKYKLKSFTLETTEEYINHRLAIAGGNPGIFSKEAMETATRPVPFTKV